METKSNISLLGFRRRMMQSVASKSELPLGYFPCEYIESDGASFIDTGLLGKSGLQVKCKCSFNNIASVHNVFGVLEGTNRLFIQYDNAEGLLYAYGAWNDTNASISANEVYEMDATFNVGSQSFKLDGTELYSGTSSTNISTSLNAYLFALNLNGTPNFQAKMRLYYCKIYDNGTLVRDYIPCVNPEGYFGLYDNVTCEFYGFVKEVAGEAGTYSVNKGYWGKYETNQIDKTKYDGVYNTTGFEGETTLLSITITGCSSFTCYIRSYAENTVDYVIISKLDKKLYADSVDGEASVLDSTKYSNNTGEEALSSYKKVVYSNIDKGTHTIYVGYRKDDSIDAYDDSGYLVIEKPTAERGGNVNVVGRGKVILPSNYINAEYIEGDGNAWVDSGYFPNGNTKVVMDAQMNSYSSGFPAFFGAFGTSNKNSFAFLDPASASNYYAYYYGSSNTASNGITAGMFDRGLIIADKGTANYHGNVVSLADASFTSTNTLYLFCGNENGTLKYYASMRLYQCQIHDNGVFTKFFIPCMKDGVFGLYEMFEKVFYSSEGSSEFSGGGEDIPNIYRRGVFIEDINGYLYTESEWDDSKIPNGVAVFTDNCRFVIALDDAASDSKKWGGYGKTITDIVTTTTLSVAEKDYAGESNTDKIITQLSGYADGTTTGAPAAESCKAFVFPNGKIGYLGSVGEWRAVVDLKSEVISAMYKCGGSSFSSYMWTSTQANSTKSWYMYWSGLNIVPATRDGGCYIRAFTALKSDNVSSDGGSIL